MNIDLSIGVAVSTSPSNPNIASSEAPSSEPFVGIKQWKAKCREIGKVGCLQIA